MNGIQGESRGPLNGISAYAEFVVPSGREYFVVWRSVLGEVLESRRVSVALPVEVVDPKFVMLEGVDCKIHNAKGCMDRRDVYVFGESGFLERHLVVAGEIGRTHLWPGRYTLRPGGDEPAWSRVIEVGGALPVDICLPGLRLDTFTLELELANAAAGLVSGRVAIAGSAGDVVWTKLFDARDGNAQAMEVRLVPGRYKAVLSGAGMFDIEHDFEIVDSDVHLRL